jgi:glutaredoxin 3
VSEAERGREMADVIIYTKDGCPHCAKAKSWYQAQGISFEERNAQRNLDYRREMFGYSNNDPTVPVIVEGGRLKQIGWEGRG